MNAIMDLPWVPLITLLVLIPIIIWQISAYIKNKQQNRTPKVPQIDSHHNSPKSSQSIKNVTLISNLKANKTSKKTSLVFSVTIVTFVIINVFIVTFYLSNRKISYLPRATQSVTPTLTTLDPANLVSPTLTITPTSTTSLNNNLPSPSTSPVVSPTLIFTIAPTKVPTQVLSPTIQPTLVAQAYTVPTYAPSPSPTHKPSPTLAPSPTKHLTLSITPIPSQTTIPIVGIGQFSVVLAGLSLFFLVLGLIL